jgi:hypothetical protein
MVGGSLQVQCTPASSTTKICLHDIAESGIKNTKNQQQKIHTMMYIYM